MKKFFTLMICLISVASLSSCGEKEEKEVLNVYNWGEYISDGSEGTLDVNKAFEEYYFEKFNKEITVNYTTYASNEDMYNKLRSGAASYDIIIPSDYMIDKMRREDMLLKLNFDNIPNYQYIDEQYKGKFYDENNEYTVPYFCGNVGIIYNPTLLDGEVTDWDCMWNEENKGKILQFNNPRDAFGTAMYYKGFDVNTTNIEEWNEAAELLKSQKPYIQSYVMDEIFNKMKNGSAAIAPYYAGDFLTMYLDNPDLAFVYPKNGSNMFVDAMCIPACAKNKRAAEEYINFFLTEEIAVANAEYVCYVSPNVLVAENEEYIECMTEIHEDALEILYPPEDIKFTYYENLDIETTKLMNSLWESLKVESSVEARVYIFAGAIVLALLVLMMVIGIRRKINSRYY